MVKLADKNLRVAVIVRVSSKDGMGHFFRVLGLFPSLANSFIAHVFIVGDILPSQSAELGEKNWSFCENDELCHTKVKDWDPDVVIFDTLRFEERSFQSIRQSKFTVSISPIFEHLSSTDIIFHRTIEVPPEWESTEFLPKVYKGLDYVLVSPGIQKVGDFSYELAIEEPKLSVGLSLGGVDEFNDTLSVLDSLKDLHQEAVFWVVLGEGYAHDVESLMAAARKNHQEIIVVRSNETMWRILRNVSVVITAGGMTTYEAAIAGIPSITVLRNQSGRFLVSELEKGNVTQVFDISQLENGEFAGALDALVTDRSRLKQMRRSAQVLKVDYGAHAVTETISTEMQKRGRGLKR